MVAKKDYLKKKLVEKQMEILLQIIEGEVENAYQELILEQDYDADAGSIGSNAGKGGISRFWRDRSQLPGLIISPAQDIFAAFKKFAAKMGVALAGFIGMTISGAIAALLPFNDPRTVKWIGKKFLAWETESMKWIDEQFRTETEQMRQGWETFKNDFWGIGFVAAPFGAIAAAAAGAKGLDAALSVGNVITGGKLGALLEKINLDVEDPGDLESYLQRGTEEEERKRKEKLKKDMYSSRCLANLDDPNWIDPECLGFADRSMFPAGEAGQQDFIDFVTGNAYTLSNIRRQRYKIDFGKDPGYSFSKGLDDDNVIQLLKRTGVVTENYFYIPSNKKIINEEISIEEGLTDLFKKVKNVFTKQPASSDAKKQGTGPDLDTMFATAMSGPASKTSAANQIQIMKKKFGPEKTNELLKKIAEKLVNDPTAKAAEQQWSAANLPKAMGAFSQLNNAVKTGQVPNITMPQVQQYERQAGNIASGAVKKAAKFEIPADRLAMISQIAQETAKRDLSPLIQTQQTVAQTQQAPATAPTVTAQTPTQPVAQPQQPQRK